MRFNTFAEFKASYPKEAAMMEDPSASKFVKEMKQKIVDRENLTPRMRSALSKIASEQELSKTLDVPAVGTKVAFCCEIFEVKRDTDKRQEQLVCEFRTAFGMRGRIQIDNDYETDETDEVGLLRALEEKEMRDHESKGSLWLEIRCAIVWKKNTFIIVKDVREVLPCAVGAMAVCNISTKGCQVLPERDYQDDVDDIEEEIEARPSRIKRERKPKKEKREKPQNDFEQLQQDAEDAGDGWEKSLDF